MLFSLNALEKKKNTIKGLSRASKLLSTSLVSKAILAPRDQREQKEMTAQMVKLVPWELKAKEEIQELQGTKERKEQQVLMVM